MSHTLFFDPIWPPWPLFGPPWGPKTWEVHHFPNIACLHIPKWRVWRPKGSSKTLGNFFSPWGANWGSGGPWTHFSTDFQNIDYFWNQQAIPVLLGSLVLFKLALEMKNNWFCIFVQNLGLSQKITLCLISQQKSWECKFHW